MSGLHKNIKTLEELGLGPFDFIFPPGFTPRYIAMNDNRCWYVFDTAPTLNNGTWDALGERLEMGVDRTDGLRNTPACGRHVLPENSLFQIAPYNALV